ncbi:MAG: alpha/beta hydrolase [Burkholderiaceae bacterium]|jgi:pimeloyl-ACP methyl ester carboxylesterase
MQLLSRLLLLVVITAVVPRAAHGADAPGTADPVYGAALGIGLEEWPYPYTVHFLELMNQGQRVRMAYMDIPPTGAANGHTVVLLHGKNFAGFYWDGPIRLLMSAGFRVVVPDQIGFGKSAKPDLAYSFDLLAANTLTLLDAIHVSRFTLLGHSTGGMLAARIALSYPARVERLVLEDPIGLEDYRRSVPAQSIETLYEQQLAATPESYRRYVQGYFVHWSSAFEHQLVEPYVRLMASGEYPRFAKAAALTSLMIYQEPVIYEFPDLKMPVLIIYGEKDRTAPGKAQAAPAVAKTLGDFPKLARQAAAMMADARVIEVADVGHIPHLEAPAQFNSALMEFLSGGH